MEDFRFIPMKGELARHITPLKEFTDDYYERWEEQILSGEAEAEHNDKLIALEEWQAERAVMNHLDLKKEVLSEEQYDQYMRKVLNIDIPYNFNRS